MDQIIEHIKEDRCYLCIKRDHCEKKKEIQLDDSLNYPPPKPLKGLVSSGNVECGGF